MRPPRIHLGPYEVAGYYAHLARGFERLGVPCHYGVLMAHPFAFAAEQPKGLRALALWIDRRRRPLPTRDPRRLAALLLYGLVVAAYGLGTVGRCDTYIFGFGHSFLPFNLDLPLLRLLGKRVIVNLGHGCEMRLPYCDGSYQSADGLVQPTAKALAGLTSRRARRARWLERWAHAVVGAPLSTAPLARQRFVNWFALGVPCAPQAAEPAGPAESAQPAAMAPLRLLHSPSHPALKGTAQIRQAVVALQQQGYALEYRELSGCTNAEVLQALQQCDLLLDQLYSDTPMAQLATEAACLGKPALVAGYGFDTLRQLVPPDSWPPSLLCRPEDLQSTLAEQLRHPQRLRELGVAAQRFVNQQWAPQQVASRYLQLIAAEIPPAWWVDPQAVLYLQGCGQSEAQTRRAIRAVIAHGGVAALQLAHRPALQQAMVQFAG